MICDRAEQMERARQKHQRKHGRKPAAVAPEAAPPEGALAHAKQLTGNAASAVGAAVRSAVEALTGKS